MPSGGSGSCLPSGPSQHHLSPRVMLTALSRPQMALRLLGTAPKAAAVQGSCVCCGQLGEGRGLFWK